MWGLSSNLRIVGLTLLMNGFSWAFFIKVTPIFKTSARGPKHDVIATSGNMREIFIVGMVIGIDIINDMKRVIIQFNNHPLQPSKDVLLFHSAN